MGDELEGRRGRGRGSGEEVNGICITSSIGGSVVADRYGVVIVSCRMRYGCETRLRANPHKSFQGVCHPLLDSSTARWSR